MPDQPLGYFITFSTYGTWLHGQTPGSVDDQHNQFGQLWIGANPQLRQAIRGKMTQEPYSLDEVRRTVVRDAIVEECRFRQWTLLALHVRTNHVHLVVTADRAAEFVMRSCKAHASKCLSRAGLDDPERKRWTTHGSTKYLWNEDAMNANVEYTLHRQGVPMAVYPEVSQNPS